MELRSEKKQLLASLDYAEDTDLSTVKKDISAMEANLTKLEQQEQKYTDELNAALAEYSELKAQAADFDPDELAMAQLEIRPQKEASAESKIQAAYGINMTSGPWSAQSGMLRSCWVKKSPDPSGSVCAEKRLRRRE